MNGFSYVANRWDFTVGLLIAAAFTVTYDKLFELTKKEKILAAAAVLVYGVLAFALPSGKTVKYEFLILLITVGTILILQLKWFHNRKILRETIITALILLTLGFHGYAYYSPGFSGYADEFLSKTKVEQLSEQGVLSLIPEVKNGDKSFYRIETYGDSAMNEALTVGYHDVSGYFSLMDGNITSYLKNLELLSQKTAYRFENLDDRTILDTLTGVKYFVAEDASAAPYGFEFIKEVKDGVKSYYLFRNSNALPLGYVYQNYMPESDYYQLDVLEKQNAMMSAVILDQAGNYAARSGMNTDQGIEKKDVKISTDNVTISGNSIKVLKAGGTLTLDFNAKPDTETYVRFDGLNISEKKKVMTTFYVKADNGAQKEVNVRSMYYNSYFGKENYLINTGYSKAGETRVTITFPEKEEFSYGGLSVYSLDMSSYQEQVNSLKQTVFQNIKRTNNQISGDITLNQKGIMALGIPYSKGWTAYVDGRKTGILKANVMYMALPLDPGKHQITLKYVTPLLKEGLLVSFLSFVTLIGIILIGSPLKTKTKGKV
jgi:uncharacterized membrane protein YfhO